MYFLPSCGTDAAGSVQVISSIWLPTLRVECTCGAEHALSTPVHGMKRPSTKEHFMVTLSIAPAVAQGCSISAGRGVHELMLQ